MTYKVIDIEGVGEVYAEKLIAAGIKTDAELLEKCAKPAGRKALEAETGQTIATCIVSTVLVLSLPNC